MISLEIDQVLLETALPAAAIGLALGALIVWLIARHRHNALVEKLESAELRLKNQETLQAEREAAFEMANARLPPKAARSLEYTTRS